MSASCRIEGGGTGWDEALQIIPEDTPEESEQHDILNCLNALEEGIRDLAAVPFTVKWLQRVHIFAMAGLRGHNVSPGDFRQIQTFVGARKGRVSTATYVPPPQQEITGLMADLERYACEDRALPPLLQCAIIHAQFEMIHPFRDGNGKMGRLLLPLYLIYRRATRFPVLMLSPYFERNRREYYHRLRSLSHYGEWEQWLMFFLDGVARQSQEALESLQQLAALREELRGKLIETRGTGTVLRVLDMLLENPYVMTNQVTQKLGVTMPTARGALAVLENLGFIEETTGRKRGQKFCATAVLDIMVRHD